MQFVKQNISISCLFINYHCIIDSFQYLLLPDEYWVKEKHCHITSQITNQKSFVLIIYYEKMENNDELKEINIKNRMCYYFNDIKRVVGKILLNKKSYKNILIYVISYKTL